MRTTRLSIALLAALSSAFALACNRSPPPPPGMNLQPLKMDVPANTPPSSPIAPPPVNAFAPQPDAGMQTPLMPLRESAPNQPDSVLACADDWLGRHHLNEYGDPPGTEYAGGTPLFNERTGQHTLRLDYLFAQNAELRADCAPKIKANAPGAAQPIR